MKIKSLFIYFFILFQGYFVSAQNFTPIFENISDELPSSEVHDIYQDSIGYMWFATDRGIARYDGSTMLEIQTDKYFKASIFNFFEESKQKVWVNTSDNELYWFNPQDIHFKFTPYIYNEVLRNTIKKMEIPLYLRKIYWSKGDLYATFLKGTGYIKVSKKGLGFLQSPIEVMKQNHLNSRLIISVDSDVVYTHFIDCMNDENGISIDLKENKKIDIPTNVVVNNVRLYGLSDLSFKKNKLFGIIGNIFFNVNEGKVKYCELPTEGLKFIEIYNGFLVTTFNGVYRLDKNFNIVSSFLTGLIVTSVLKDKEDIFWFTTVQNGVFKAKNIDMNILKTKNTIPTFLKSKNSKLFVINSNIKYSLYSLNGNFISHGKAYKLNNLIRITDTVLHSILGYENTWSYKESKSIDYIENRKFGYTVFVGKSNVFVIKKGKRELTDITNFKSKITDCIPYTDTLALLTTVDGLYEFNIYSKKLKEILKTDVRLLQIENYNKNFVIRSPQNVYIYHPKNVELNQIDLPVNTGEVKGYYVDSLFVYIYSSDGVFLYHVENNKAKTELIVSTIDLPSREIFSLTTDTSFLWIGIKKGVVRLPLNSTVMPPVISKNNFIIDSLTLNGSSLINKDTIELKSNQSFDVYYKYISFKNNKLKYYYKIGSSDWIQTLENKTHLSNLDYGFLNLKFKIESDVGTKTVSQIILHVKKPFYLSLIFLISMMILFFTLLIGIYYRIIANAKKRENERLAKVNLELKLLTSQMNPHFMFNTINSIQHYIMKNNRTQAMEYLSDFALLVRKSLDFSIDNLIPLSEEISFLKLYLDLENKRFEENFSLRIDVDSGLNVDLVKVPGLLLQPLIENIILHSKYEDGEKEIKIMLENKGQFILIKVMDFGQNKFNITNNVDGHTSHGLNILRKRLKLLNGNRFKEMDVLFEPTNKILNTGFTVILKLFKNENTTY